MKAKIETGAEAQSITVWMSAFKMATLKKINLMKAY